MIADTSLFQCTQKFQFDQISMIWKSDYAHCTFDAKMETTKIYLMARL